MIKDIFKSLNSIHRDSNLTLEEKHLLTILIKYHNVEEQYAYPTYKNLLEECSTNRRSKISKIIKGLKEKAYVEVVKVRGNKSHYYIKKHLFFIEETDSNKNQNSTGASNEEVQAEKVKVKQHPNNSKIAKETNIGLTPYYCEVFSHIDETVLEMALKEKAKSATLLLRKCIRISKEVGLAFGKEFTNKVLKFESYKEEYESSEECGETYVKYMDRKVELGLI